MLDGVCKRENFVCSWGFVDEQVLVYRDGFCL